jgi:hypothetical protein
MPTDAPDMRLTIAELYELAYKQLLNQPLPGRVTGAYICGHWDNQQIAITSYPDFLTIFDDYAHEWSNVVSGVYGCTGVAHDAVGMMVQRSVNPHHYFYLIGLCHKRQHYTAVGSCCEAGSDLVMSIKRVLDLAGRLTK